MYKDILYPIDITEEGSWRDTLPVVLEYIKAFKSRLHIMTVVSDGSMSIVKQYLPKGTVEKYSKQPTKIYINLLRTIFLKAFKSNMLLRKDLCTSVLLIQLKKQTLI